MELISIAFKFDIIFNVINSPLMKMYLSFFVILFSFFPNNNYASVYYGHQLENTEFLKRTIVKKKRVKKRRFFRKKHYKANYRSSKKIKKQTSILALIIFFLLGALLFLVGVFLVIFGFPHLVYLIIGAVFILTPIITGLIAGYAEGNALVIISTLAALLIAIAFLIWYFFVLSMFLLVLALILFGIVLIIGIISLFM